MSLSAMKQKKLKNSGTGTWVEITTNKNKDFTGFITDNDGECLEIRVDDRCVYVDYTEIDSFAILDGRPVSAAPVPPLDPAELTLEQKLLNTVSEARSLSFWCDYTLSPSSDGKLRDFLSVLPRECRHTLSSILDSLLFGFKTNNPSKQHEAIVKLRRFLQDNSELAMNPDVAKLAGHMLMRVSGENPLPVFENGCCWYEMAALYACSDTDDNWIKVMEYTVTGLLKEAASKNELLTLLTLSLMNTGDASLLPVLAEQGGSACRSELTEIIDFFCRTCDLSKADGTNLVKRCQQLAEQFPAGINTSHITSVEGDLFEYSYENGCGTVDCNGSYHSFRVSMLESDELREYLETLHSRDLDADPLKVRVTLNFGIPVSVSPCEGVSLHPEVFSGQIIRLQWADHAGTIRAESNKTLSFRYADISDNRLRKTIDALMRSDLSSSPISVTFVWKGSRALNINGVKESVKSSTPEGMLSQARQVLADASNENRFRDANVILATLFDSSVASKALVDYLKNVVTICKEDMDQELLQQAVHSYMDHKSRYPRTLDARRTLLNFTRRLGNPDMIQESLDLLMELTTEELKSPINYLVNLDMCVAVTQDEYRSTRNPLYLEQSRKYAEEMYSFVRRYPEFRSTYLNNWRNSMLYYYIESDNLAEAERTLTEAQQDPSFIFDPTGDLARSLNALRARCQAQPSVEPVKVPTDLEQTVPAEISRAENVVAEPEADTLTKQSVGSTQTDEELPVYIDTDGWESLDLTKIEAGLYALSFPGKNRLPSMVAYLKAASSLNPALKPLYFAVSYACGNPLEELDYTPSHLMLTIDQCDNDFETLNNWAMATAALRSAFMSSGSHNYYLLDNLRSKLPVIDRTPPLNTVFNSINAYVSQYEASLKESVDHHSHEQAVADVLNELQNQASNYYDLYVNREQIADPGFPIMPILKGISYNKNTLHARLLMDIMESDPMRINTALTDLRNSRAEFEERFINSDKVSPHKLADIIDAYYEDACTRQGWSPNDKLTGQRRDNLASGLSSIAGLIYKWYQLDDLNRTSSGAAASYHAFLAIMPSLCRQLQELEDFCAACPTDSDAQQSAGMFLLGYTARELCGRLDGSHTSIHDQLFFDDFLTNDYVMLNEDFIPDLSGTFCALPDFNILDRIRAHASSQRIPDEEHLQAIYKLDSTNPNYGTAALILRRAELLHHTITSENPAWEHPETILKARARSTWQACDDFRQLYAMAENQGQLRAPSELLKSLPEVVTCWYKLCDITHNYGFVIRLIRACRELIRSKANAIEANMYEQLEGMKARHPEIFSSKPDAEEIIRDRIHNHNFVTAEKNMSDLLDPNSEFSMLLNLDTPDALQELRRFWNEYPENYLTVSRPQISVQDNLRSFGKVYHNGQGLLDAWIGDSSAVSPSIVEQLLEQLGWKDFYAEAVPFRSVDGEVFKAQRKKDSFGVWTPQHSIAAFGSELNTKCLYVVCLYGAFTCDRLIKCFTSLEALQSSKLVLIDYALTNSERRELACSIKKLNLGFSSSMPYLLIDRVMLVYLAAHYDKMKINRLLMSVGMPFSFYQPYVPDSGSFLPSELFIGRKNELSQIVEYNGPNLVYGGRQLGKSALLKKARSDNDGVNGCRAVFVDLHYCDCTKSASDVTTELVRNGIFCEGTIIGNWKQLCNAIADRLRSDTDPISYLLLLMDEADSFLQDCANCDYAPIDELKKLQASMSGHFKFVLAGLHNVVRFNRDQALANNITVAHLSSINVKPFSREEGMELLIEPLSYLGFSLSDSQIAENILAHTNNFPGLIQLYCKKLIESVRSNDYAGYISTRTPPYTINSKQMAHILTDPNFRFEVRNKLSMTLRIDANENDTGYYYPLALIIALMNTEVQRNSSIGYTADQILEFALSYGVLRFDSLSRDAITALLDELTDLNVLSCELYVNPTTGTRTQSYNFALSTFRDLLGTSDEIFDKLTNTEDKL